MAISFMSILLESPSYHLTPCPPLHEWRGGIDVGFHASLCPQGMGGYIKERTVSGSSSFILCCVRLSDMTVIFIF